MAFVSIHLSQSRISFANVRKMRELRGVNFASKGVHRVDGSPPTALHMHQCAWADPKMRHSDEFPLFSWLYRMCFANVRFRANVRTHSMIS